MKERNWKINKLNGCGKETTKVWKNVKNMLNWKNNDFPSQLFYKGKLISKPQELAEAQNNYFLEQIRLIRENLPAAVTDPLTTLRNLMQGRQYSFSLATVHAGEVAKILENLSNSSSFGFLTSDTYTIKLIKNEILPALTRVVNVSIITRTFPELWK